jgi:hypothetical protein
MLGLCYNPKGVHEKNKGVSDEKMEKEDMKCVCGFEAVDKQEFEEHIDTCEQVGTDTWEAWTTL